MRILFRLGIKMNVCGHGFHRSDKLGIQFRDQHKNQDIEYFDNQTLFVEFHEKLDNHVLEFLEVPHLILLILEKRMY